MSFKKYIEDYINDNFTLVLSEKDFKVFDKRMNSYLEVSTLTQNIYTIFFGGSKHDVEGKNLSLVFKITNAFYGANRKKILSSFYEGLEGFDYKKSSIELIDNLIELLDKLGLAETTNRSNNFLFNLFNEYYYEKYVELGKLERIKNSIHPEYHTSSHVNSIVNTYCQNEAIGVNVLITAAISDYYIACVNKKVKTFLERSTVKLGDRNWYIDNLDYGRLEIDGIEKIFHNETPEVLLKIKEIFDAWYYPEVEKASEKIMNIC
jgi:hypothetical protein